MDTQQKLELYLEGLHALMPGIDVTSMSSFYSGEKPTSAKIILSGISDALKNFFEFDQSQNIVHYTSITSMLAIFNSESLRLYNCFNLNDPKEIEYANNKYTIGLTNEEIETFKQNYFVGSFCKYDQAKKNDNFNMWRLYGQNGNGAALVFEMENGNDCWENVFMGKVIYEDDKTYVETFKKVIEFHKRFNKNYALFENIPDLFPIIGLFLKDNIWKVEDEFRIFTSCPFDEYKREQLWQGTQNSYLANTLNHTINARGDLVSFISIPLNKNKALTDLTNRGLSEELAIEFFSSIPHLKLKKVILGHNVHPDLIGKILKLFDLQNSKSGSEIPELEYSPIRKKFR